MTAKVVVSQSSLNSSVYDKAATKAVGNYLKQLENHCRACEDNFRYQEADVTIKRVGEIKCAESERLRIEFRQNFANKIDSIRNLQAYEIKELNVKWDKKLDNFDYNLTKQKRMKILRYERQKLDLNSKLETNRFAPKFSPQLLNLRSIQTRLAKQQMYSQAELIKQKADRLEQEEMEQRRQQYFDRQTGEVNKQNFRQQKEIRAWEEKIMTQRFEIMRSKEKELEVLKKRHSAQLLETYKQHAKESKQLDFQIMFTYGLKKQAGTSNQPADVSPAKSIKPRQRPMSATTPKKSYNQQVNNLYKVEENASLTKRRPSSAPTKRPQSAKSPAKK
eukprot:TRINITY_DN5749_c0_g2_i1.p1 TRINITY_DN5749_c0_g2~~TRINITY_DN5749_c0_g2_i1.p1  ORF type:complete len:333 (-),score=43.69 TRINITY_DN5749_c0_g2_i1:336-1334(-)